MAQQIDNHCNEYNRLMNILNYRLPHQFKKIGLFIAIGLFVLILASKFMGDSLIVKDLLRSLILFFLLISALSKEAIEDEHSRYLRFQSITIAFILTTAYAVLIPLISLALDYLITNVSGNGTVNFYEISAFEIIFTILCFQMLIFETLKRFTNAE